MKITLSWIQDYLTSSINLKDVYEGFNRIGLCVQNVTNFSKDLSQLIVSKIISCKLHTKINYLKIYNIALGSKEVQVVSRYLNIILGQKIVLALPNNKISLKGKLLTESIIFGEINEAFICSYYDIGLGLDKDNPIILSNNAPLGSLFIDYASLDDVVFDIEITPNRGDTLSAYGLSRDLASINKEYFLKKLSFKKNSVDYTEEVSINIDSDVITSSCCSFFSGRMIRNIDNCNSPQWMKNRLLAIGIHPISFLVDITNYIIHDLGQPLHVYDLDKLHGNINVKFAKSGDIISALDNKNYKLNKSMLVVSDENSCKSIAGIIGGIESACTLNTKNIFLESGFFNSINISNTSRFLNVNTESSYRFERSVDINMVLPALEKATKMILDVCGGKVSNILSCGNLLLNNKIICFNPYYVKTLGGSNISLKYCNNILLTLGFKVKKINEFLWNVLVPSWRNDIFESIDLVEEILRVVGYNSIIPEACFVTKFFSHSNNLSINFYTELYSVKKSLISSGISEIITWSFISKFEAKLFSEDIITLESPINKSLSTLRPSLLPGLLLAAKRNNSFYSKGGALFEIGNVYNFFKNYIQSFNISIIRFGVQVYKTWRSDRKITDSFYSKGDAINVLSSLGVDITTLTVKTDDLPNYYHPFRSGYLVEKLGNKLAIFGEIHPSFKKYFDLENINVSFTEVFVNNIDCLKKNGVSNLDLSNYPFVIRDFSFLLDKSILAQDLLSAIWHSDINLIQKVSVFDVYDGEKIHNSKRSLALSIIFGSKMKTLTESEINKISLKIINNVNQYVGGVLRK